MAHGYECDRCDTFVEQADKFRETHPDHGQTETVSVIDEDKSKHKWTLCNDCRNKLVAWVDSGGESAGRSLYGSAKLIDATLSFDWNELTEVSGVGSRKAQKLYGAGYRTKRDLKTATQSELAEVDSIGNALAARIKADVGGLKPADAVVKEIDKLIQQYRE